MPPEDLTSSSPASPQDDSSLLTSPVPPPEQAPVFADRIALDQTLQQPSMADRIAVDEEENKRQRLENERKRMKEVDLLSKILPDTKSQTKEMAGIQTQANALIDPKLYTDMTVNWRATAALMGKPLDELDATQYGDYKAQIAVKLNKPAPKSESEYRSMLSEYFVREKDKDTALNELYGNVVLKAFQDTGMGKNRAMVGLPTEYVKQWEEQHKDLIGGDAGFHAQANRVYNQTLKDIESIRGKGAETFSALMDFTQGKADDERIAQVAEHLSSSTPEERQKVYNYIGLAAEAGHIDRAGIEQFAINMGQSFSRGFDFIPQGTLQGQEDAFREMRDTLATGKVWLRKAEGTPTLNDVYRPSQGAVGSAINIDLTGREATPEEVATLKAQAEGGLKTFGVIRELRNAAKSSVDPIRPVFEDSAIERGAYGLAGSLGIMVPVAINPAIGMLAYQAQEYDRIMLENPEIDPTFAKGLSLVEGAGNAALDRLQLGAINGKLPVFGGLLNGIKNNGIRRVLTTVGVEILEQNLQEGAQDLIAPLTETMAAALREDMPDKDFGALMKEYAGSRAETFFAVLPLALIGGGIGTYRDLKNPAMQLADKQLAMAGFGPAQRDYINQASSMEEKATRIEQEWSKRTEQDITAGKEQLAASIAEARSQKAGDTVEVNTKADGTNEWIVRDPAGKEVARVASEGEAVTIIADRGEAEIKSQANVVADLLDSDWRKDKLPNFEAQFGGEVTPEQLLKDAEAKGDTKLVEAIKASIEAHGNDPTELAKLRVLGESRITPYAEGQYKAFVKLNEGATAQDAFEEIVHNIFDIDIAEGRITKEQARAWVSQTTAAGVAKYKFGTDAEVRESMAQIAQDFARNKIDQTNLPSSFVAFLKKLYTEFVEFMRRAKLLDQAFAEGKIDAEFERYLSEKIGLSDATMIEREVNRIEGEQGGGQQLDLFLDSRATPEAGADVRTVGDTKIVGPTSFAIRAYHGTPHEVDRFSTEKIGTGEGAAAFGYGLYFAQNQQVARIYQEQLRPLTEVRNLTVGGIEIYKDGNPVDYSPYQYTRTPKPEDYARASLQEDLLINEHELRSAFDSKGIQGAKEAMEAVIKDRLEMAREEDPEKAPFYETALKRLQDDHNTHVDFEKGKSNLYRVEIDAEEDHLLLWDKSINDQPDAVKEIVRGILKEKGYLRANDNGPRVLKSAFDAYKMAEGAAFRDGDGSGIYEMIASNLIEKSGSARGSDYAAEKMASDLLDKNGIRGIKYLDAGSRGTSKRTHNFVIFDGKHIQITEKNGQPVSVEDVPVDGDTSFSIRARDEAYDAAVKSGDEAEQQRLVNEAAKEAGYTPVFRKGSVTKKGEGGFHFGSELQASSVESKEPTKRYYIYAKNPIRLVDYSDWTDDGLTSQGYSLEASTPIVYLNRHEGLGDRGAVDADGYPLLPDEQDALTDEEFLQLNTIATDSFIIRDPSQIKSADPITRDAEGNVIPLSQRFNPESNDIRFSIRKNLQAQSKSLGLAASGTNADMSEAIRIISTDPKQWTKEDLDRIAPELSIHQDFKEGAGKDPERVTSIMRDGLKSGMVDSVYNWTKDQFTYAKGRLEGGDAYIFLSGKLKYLSKDNPRLAEGNIPLMHIQPKAGEDLLEAINRTGKLNNLATSFSIQSQEQIDRVNKAVADTTQFAEGRMALYERAKERFKAVLAENKDILDALKEGGAAPEKIRRQKLIQGIAELEVILRQLPAEVRGKVGGFSQVASIDPVSVMKNGEVVATSKNEKGAIVAAWLQEGLSIGKANQKTSLPDGYTIEGKEDDQMHDRALADFFKKRLQIIDKELEKYLAKEYLEKIETTLQNAKPRKGDSGVKKSTLGAVVQEFADKAYEASLLDNDATVERLESLEKQIAKADDPKKEADLVEAWAITNTFGALAEQSSSRLKAALDYLKKELAGGRAARRAAEQARIDDIREKQGVISDALPGWTDAGLNKVNSPGWWEETKDLARQMVWSHASYEQILRRILPPEAQGIVEEWSDRIRRANGKTEAAALKNWQNLIQAIQSGFGGKGFMKTADALSELGEKREGKVSKLEGRQVELETIPIDKAEQLVRGEMNRGEYTKADIKQMEDALIAMPIESRRKHISIYRVIEEGRTESIPMTLDEMIFTTMAWEQADVRVKMENSGWTQESYDQMVKEIASSKVATAVRDYLKDFYRNSTKKINPVYSRMFGMGLPDNPDYAPTTYESRKASGEMSVDGSAVQNTTTPGFAKARVTHNEAFKITPATQIYQQRSSEQAQWVAFAELHREMNAVLNGKNVRLSMKQENGKRLSELMSQVLDNIAKGGGVNTDAAYMKKWLGAATAGTAVASMSYNLKTIFNQFDAVTRFLYAMPLKDVMRAISNPQKVLESVPKSWNSETVQNRVLQGSNPAARFALKQAGMTPGKFLSAWYGVGATGLQPMQYGDGGLTTLSSAIVYSDAHAKALKAGLSEKDAEARALDAMDAAIWRFSQPVMFSAKSPVENNSHAAMKLLYMFASDARLKTGILIDAVQSIKDGKGSKADHLRRIGVVFLGAMLAQTVSNIYRDIFSDDDDDEIWTAGGYAKAAMLAPFQGFFLLGTAIDVAASSLTGQRAYTNSSNPLVTAGINAINAAKHSSDILQTDDMEAFFKELGRIARAISLTPVTAVPAAVLNPVKPIVGAKKNMDTGD
ncbi:MAG: hypothetical protein AN484_16680 [Aphanizomenon flos-aquae WA102]|uniref:Uncharacterized protein n=1 Tax=Aphanizomenon flos-aquae WA102 TaxID=1710896 RepID=A0A1B7WZZ4_APHFL|nr:MAG: hypothetical protein AN484_16680 [Aphanizomenon flos-aquae WA102]